MILRLQSNKLCALITHRNKQFFNLPNYDVFCVTKLGSTDVM